MDVDNRNRKSDRKSRKNRTGQTVRHHRGDANPGRLHNTLVKVTANSDATGPYAI